MSNGDRVREIVTKRVVYDVPGTQRVNVERDVVYGESSAGPLTMDVYRGADLPREAKIGAVVIVLGYPDPGARAKLGSSFKEMGWSLSWARLIAASGLVAITYTNQDPAADLITLLGHVRLGGATLGIDAGRIGLLATSGHAPLALWALVQDEGAALKCAVLGNPYTLDLDGGTGVADAAKTFGFVTPAAGRSASDLPPNVPLFLVRSGRDEMPRLNEALDHFVVRALAANRDVTLVNHAAAPHAFDLFHDSDASRSTIRQMLLFLQSCLGG